MGARVSARDRQRTRAMLGLVVIVIVGVALGYVIAAARSDGGADRALSSTDPGVIHVHGLGVDPADGTLYAATHAGLFRLPERAEAVRVANRFQDTMGFTVVGRGEFLGSGHPDVREMTRQGMPSLLGLIESDDAGVTWRNLSLGGEADFHVLVATHAQVYGYDGTNQRLMVTKDQRTWETRSSVVLGSFAVDPADPEHLVGSLEGAVTVSSSDGGRSWLPVPGAPRLSLVAWNDRGGLWGAGPDWAIWQGGEDGMTWERRGELGGPPEALLATDEALYAAAEGVGVLESGDGATSWAVRYAAQPSR